MWKGHWRIDILTEAQQAWNRRSPSLCKLAILSGARLAIQRGSSTENWKMDWKESHNSHYFIVESHKRFYYRKWCSQGSECVCNVNQMVSLRGKAGLIDSHWPRCRIWRVGSEDTRNLQWPPHKYNNTISVNWKLYLQHLIKTTRKLQRGHTEQWQAGGNKSVNKWKPFSRLLFALLKIQLVQKDLIAVTEVRVAAD